MGAGGRREREAQEVGGGDANGGAVFGWGVFVVYSSEADKRR